MTFLSETGAALAAVSIADDTPAPLESAAELLARARAAGVRVKLLGSGEPHFRFPPAAFDLVQQLRERRAEVVALLRAEADQLEALHRVAMMGTRTTNRPRTYPRPRRGLPASKPGQPGRSAGPSGFGWRPMRKGRER